MRIEVGPRDLAKGMCVSARRDRPGREGKAFDVPLEPGAFVAHVRGLLDDVQARLMSRCSADIMRENFCLGCKGKAFASINPEAWAPWWRACAGPYLMCKRALCCAAELVHVMRTQSRVAKGVAGCGCAENRVMDNRQPCVPTAGQ